MTDRTEGQQPPVTECDRASNAAVAAGIGEPLSSALDRLAREDRRRRRKAEMRRQRGEQRQVHTFVAGVAWAWGGEAMDGTLALPAGLRQPDYARDLLRRICPALAERIIIPQEGAEPSAPVGCDPLTIATAPTLVTVPELADASKDIGRLCVPPTPPKDVPPRAPKLDHAPLMAFILPEAEAEKEARRVEHRWLERVRRKYEQDPAVLRDSDDFAAGEDVEAVLGPWTRRDQALADMFILLHRAATAWTMATYPGDDEAARTAVAREMARAISEIPYAPDPRLVALFHGRIAWTTQPRPGAPTARTRQKDASMAGAAQRGSGQTAEK